MGNGKLKTNAIKQAKNVAGIAAGTAVGYGIGLVVPGMEPDTMAMIGTSLSVANAYGRDTFEKIAGAAVLFGAAFGIQNGSLEDGIVGGIAAGTGMAIFERVKRFNGKRIEHKKSAKVIKEWDEGNEKAI